VQSAGIDGDAAAAWCIQIPICFGERRTGKFAKDWEELGVIHTELRNTEATYTKELQAFAQHQAPRLDQMRERLKSVSRRIGITIAAPASGATTP
jgi:hypothetical protein